MTEGMKPEDVADFGAIRVEVPADAMYVAIAIHRHADAKSSVVGWTGLLGWTPLADAIPLQLLDKVQAEALRRVQTSKYEVKVLRVVPPTTAGPKGVIIN